MTDLEEQRERAYNAVVRLGLVSHANTQNIDSDGRGADSGKPGSRPPTGGIDRRGDREPDYPQKSQDVFIRRLSRARTAHAYEQIADDAEATLKAWARTPECDGFLERVDENGDFRFSFKRMIANSDDPIATLARIHGITRKTIYVWRSLYRERDA